MEPAVGVDDLCRSLGVLVVTQHDAAAPDADLAGLVQLIFHIVVGLMVVGLAHGAHVVGRLGEVQDAVAEGLGHAVALVDDEAVLDQLQKHLGVEGSRRAAQVPQAVQTADAAALHVVVDGLHQHGGRGHDVAVHQAQVAVEVADVAAEVQGPAGRRVGHDADEAGHVEEGQQGHMAQRQLLACREAVGDPVLCHLRIGVQAGAHIPLREHDALAAAGGAGGEHQHHQIIVAHAVGQLAGGSLFIAVHGAELRAVGGFQLGAAAVVDAVVQDEGRLHEAQLIFQLLPGLFLVQSHENAAGEDDAVGRHAEFIAVPAQQNDAPALDVRHFGLEIGRHPADVLRILAILLLHDGLAVLGHIANGHMIRKLLFHAAGHHVVYACGYFDVFSHRFFSFFVKFSAQHFFHSLSRVIPNLWQFEENFGTTPYGNSIPQAERKRKI